MISGREIEKIFQKNGERVFFINADTRTSWTYQRFHDLVTKMAKGLTSQGLRRGERFAVLLPNSPELAALYFASILLGTIIMPVNPRLHSHEIESIVEFSKPKLLLYTPATQSFLTLRALASVPKHLALEYCASEDLAIDMDQLYQQIKPCDVFLITFTSGTTGLPKGVAHKISSIFENARLFNERMNFIPSDCFLHVMPMSYMAGILNTLICPFLAQGTIVSIPPFDARTVLSFWNPVIQYQVNAMWLAPTMLAALLKMDRDSHALEYCRAHLKAISVGTAPLPTALKNDFEKKYSTTLYESYGLSELLFITTNAPGIPQVKDSVGRLLPAIDIRMTDEEGKFLPSSSDGEIWIKTPHVMAGYVHAETSEVVPVSETAWFPTGDIGHLDSEGNLSITGRKKDLIIKGGINVSPRAIEEVLLRHPAVVEAAVVGLRHDFYGEEIVAVLVMEKKNTLEEHRVSLITLCKENLNSAALPMRYIEMDELPLNASGKIQKKTLVEQITSKSGRPL